MNTKREHRCDCGSVAVTVERERKACFCTCMSCGLQWWEYSDSKRKQHGPDWTAIGWKVFDLGTALVVIVLVLLWISWLGGVILSHPQG